MIKSLIILCLTFTCALGFAAESLSRLDPHGKKETKIDAAAVKQNRDCLVCHTVDAKGKTGEKADIPGLCMNCHNPAPHSGVLEHKAHDVSCLKCHTPHRAEGKPGDVPSSFFKLERTKKLGEDLRERSNPDSMIRKNCKDCHKWK